MGVLAINDTDLPTTRTLREALAGLPPDAPVVILIHGFRYAPGEPEHDPHQLILSATPRRGIGWPRHLRLRGDAGLAIGFGWAARRSIWAAHRRAGQAGARLARLIAHLRRLDPARPVHIMAHSLGARVALCALTVLSPRAVDRVILISAATVRSEARAAMTSPAGQTVEVLNVTGRVNALFDLLLTAALPWRGRVLGMGLPGVPGWTDLPLEQPATRNALARAGFRIPAARVRICHWSGYLRPGVFALYRAVLLHRLPMARLAEAARPAPAAVQQKPADANPSSTSSAVASAP